MPFPDFPGCITAGRNIDEAKDMAQDAITLPEMTLKEIDAAAKRRGMSRSSFLVHAAQNAIQSNHSEVSI